MEGEGGTCSQEKALGAVPKGSSVQLSPLWGREQSLMEPDSSAGKAQVRAPVLAGVSAGP